MRKGHCLRLPQGGRRGWLPGYGEWTVRQCVWAIGIGVALVVLAFEPAKAQTLGGKLARICPTAHRVDNQVTRAHALADDSQYALAKKAATLYYDCSQTLQDPSEHDLAWLFYLEMLSVSVPSNDDVHLIRTLSVVKSEANNLAASTRDP